MNKAELERMLEEHSHQADKKPMMHIDRNRLRTVLNGVFLVLAFIGIVTYYFSDHINGLIIVGVAMVVKIVEFLVRFLL